MIRSAESPTDTTAETFRPRHGAFGDYGGRFASELLRPALVELAAAVDGLPGDAEFQRDFANELRDWAGRPTSLCPLPVLSRRSGLEVWAKREDLLHGGAHKTNNVIGQALLARRLGRRRLVAETGAGQHGVATAMAAARYGLEAEIYMGAHDVERQAQNVELMQLCGARVHPVTGGAATLKEAINEALRDWTARPEDTHYALGTICGPDPYPRLVASFHEVIGREARAQFRERTGRSRPDAVVACVGGGSNALGIFSAFLDDQETALFGVEPGGQGAAPGEHGAALVRGRPGLLHGARTYVLQDDEGQVYDATSVAAGLDYPGVGPQHAALRDAGRARYFTVDDDDALAAFARCSREEGIVPAFESAHALAFLEETVARGHLPAGASVIVNVSGSGRKDLASWTARRSAEDVEGGESS